MKYVKHYWVDASSKEWLTTTNDAPNGKTYPYNIFSHDDLDVKILLTDSDGIDVCLSELPDSVTITEVVVGSKKAVIELTETQFNSVKTPYDAAEVLRNEVDELRKESPYTPTFTSSLISSKNTQIDTKNAEVQTALNLL